ncbi:hypothetical protein D6C76_08476 [Aureobasidium pullulans]|nr:hypothetical protein D6C76_08476 [Aureobasidium pullulans]
MPQHSMLRLDTIPGEIIDVICDELGKKDLKTLRLSNKRISSVATTHLAKAYMFNLCSLMTRRSLEKLAEICAHPDFGHHVRKVHLSSGRVHPREMRVLIERVEDMQRRIPPPTSSNEYELETSGDAVTLLGQAFASLRGYQTPVILDVSDFEVPRWDPVTLFLDKYNHFHGEPELCFKSTMEPCLEAIFRTKMRFAELELTVDAFSIDPDERGFDTQEMNPEDLELLSSLNSISLDLVNTFDEAGTRSAGHVLSYARSLESLTYRQGCDDLDATEWPPLHQPQSITNRQFGIADTILSSVKSTGLKSLWLEYTPISFQTLVDLLEKHADTLTSLYISSVCLRDGSWAEVFSKIKKSCRFVIELDTGSLSQARSELREDDYQPLALPKEWTLDPSSGRSEVEESLDKLTNAPSLEVLNMIERRELAQGQDIPELGS